MTSCDYKLFNNLTYYTTGIVDSSGIVLNLLCVVCIGQIVWHKSESNANKSSNLFKYLLIKAICDLVYFCFDIFALLSFVRVPIYNNMLSYTIYRLYFSKFLNQVLLMLSALMEMMATLGIHRKKILSPT
jgi:uncharacterized membrane protein